MRDAEIDDKLPRTVCLLLPDRDEMSVALRLLVIDVGFSFPWSSGETHVARHRHAGIRRLPREQRFLVSRRWPWMFKHPLLPVDGARSEQQPIIGNEGEERVARVPLLGHLRKRLLGLN